MKKSFFIAGTDTGVGKTHITCGLLAAARRKRISCVGMKPVSSGCAVLPDGTLLNEDVVAHQRAANFHGRRELSNPYAFVPPVSPHIAAAEAGVDIDFARISKAHDHLRQQADLVLIEGAGGWLAPVDEQRTMADLALALKVPVVLVVGLRLGCLNHAMLTTAVLQQQGTPVAGWVGNRLGPDTFAADANLDYLLSHIPYPMIACVSYAESVVSKKGGALDEEHFVFDRALEFLESYSQ